jgi:hypothetical protein
MDQNGESYWLKTEGVIAILRKEWASEKVWDDLETE